MDTESGSNAGSQRAPLIFVRPPKPIKEMTKAEFDTWTEAVYNEMCDRIEAAQAEAEKDVTNP